MTKGAFLSGFLLVSIIGSAQTDFSRIDDNSITIPDSLSDYREIADYLCNDLKSDRERVRAVYIWIAHNVRYDLAKMNSGRRYGSEQEIIDEVLKERKGVCQHYSALFLAMSRYLGINTYLISGYTRDELGDISELSHAWNGIAIDSAYYLIDVTWASGYELNGRYLHEFRDDYFLKSPKDFIKDHMPFDPIWQFLDNPINNNDFISRDFSKLETSGVFAFHDSIMQWEKCDEFERLEKSNKRIIANGVRNKLIQAQVDENILQIANWKYNLAIDTLNYGINSYNSYTIHKNRHFRNPKLDDSDVKGLIDNADKGISAANDILYELFSSNSELNDLIVDARNKMPDLLSEIEREKDFVERYLKKWKPLRVFMFLTFKY